MKNLFKKLIDFYHKGDVAFYFSLLGPLTMGTIHLVLTIIKFDWILVNYSVFSYLMALFKVWQWAIEKYHIKPSSYVAGIISILLVLAPMMASFIMTILYKDAPHYLFDWFIYAYALYGTLKMIFAIKGLVKKDKIERQYVLSFFGLISALYTIQMMQFNLIKTFEEEGSDNAMYLMQLFTQGVIFLFSIFVIGLFVYKLISNKRK
ncbi:MAG: hypothetical protein IJ186_04615 [Bacilli bacterium]|nr:hypothetical protein [Bacilli bacterium]